MALAGDRYKFTKENVDKTLTKHGVYELYDGKELIYIGKASGKGVTIRSRLQDHQRGDEGPCTKMATTFRFKAKTSGDADTWEEGALAGYELDNGRLPRCNDKVA